MGLFSALLRRRLDPAWEYSTRGIIWRIFPSGSGHFIGEERDLTAKTVAFFCLERKTGKILWEGMRSSDPWWITVDSVHKDVVFLHGYAEPDMPEPRRIFAHDLHDGRLLWTDETLRFLFAAEDSVYAVREETLGPKFFRVGLRDGLVVEELQADDVHRLRRMNPADDQAGTRFPVPVGAVTETGAIAGIIGGKKFRSPAIAGLEYLEAGDATVVGYYEKYINKQSEERLMHHLALYRADGKELLDEIVDTDVVAPVPDSFFSLADMLYFIRSKHVLTGVRISSEGGN
jgi:hypothetical protein